jgi:hypothetical protein
VKLTDDDGLYSIYKVVINVIDDQRSKNQNVTAVAIQ